MWDKLAGAQRVIKGVSEMQELAREVVVGLVPGDVLLLCGPLGSGKTTFVQELAQVLGVVDQVTSPTFTVVAEYVVEGQSRIKQLVHIDLYRLSDKAIDSESSVREALGENKKKEGVTLIEWAEKLGDRVPVGSKRIEFEHGESENERKVNFINHD